MIHYHEQTSYLNSGLPFQHQIFYEKKYAAKSTSFYVDVIQMIL